MLKDYVKCCNCDAKLFVDIGEEKCPNCEFIGALAWIDPDEPEVEVD